MIDFNNLNKVSNVVCRPTPTLIVKHVIYIKRIPEMKSRKYNTSPMSPNKLSYGFYYETSNDKGERYNDGASLLFSTGNVFLELESKKSVSYEEFQKTKRSVKTAKVDCSFRDMPILINALDKAYNWLTGASNDVFVRDINGCPIKIVDPLLQSTCMVGFGDSQLQFKPCIIRDAKDVRYEGIALTSSIDGEITNFTAPEFAMFRTVVMGFASNFGVINQMLMNQAMTYCTYNNLMEALHGRSKSHQ